MGNGPFGGGTGARLTEATVIVAGVASLASSLLSTVSIWFQLKNYRKPLLQRYVVRILLIVPIFAAASWTSLWSLKMAAFVEPIKEIYEAFTIYTFFQLLINFIGGERALIVMMHGRSPVHHLWPLNHCLGTVDISDPHTFLSIKRGILQYAWVKPMLSIANIVMRATNTYQEGYVGLRSGYFWSGIIYNISITVCLYALAMFWVCMADDLQAFRPMPKFLCIKLIIFASYWQGFCLSILVWLGAIPDDVTGYTPDNIAAAIQNALICFEMPAFALAHWYAFSWHDYADPTISAARMPVLFAIRDAFGFRDLIEDTKETFAGGGYQYRLFDSYDSAMAHEDSDSRVARMMEGMRYERGGKGKYWIPKPGQAHSRTPLLSKSSRQAARGMSPANLSANGEYYSTKRDPEFDSVSLNQEDERLFENAKELEFGDWNYPVITAHEASRDDWKRQDPGVLTTSTNRHLLEPTVENPKRRQHLKTVTEDDERQNSSSHHKGHRSHLPILGGLLHSRSSSSSSKSDRSQRVDLVVEDTEAEEIERVRARKEGSSRWNEDVPKHFVKVYPDSDQGEDIREGYEPNKIDPLALDTEQDDQSSTAGPSNTNEDVDDAAADKAKKVSYGSLDEERQIWQSSEPKHL